MELYVITSIYSDIPIAELRTDGKNIDWIVDNTEGRLPLGCQNSLEILKGIVDKSSHLTMVPPTEATVGLVRYTLENSDTVEITTDGKTAMLNGDLMEETDKLALMSAINGGHLKVKTKGDISKPIMIKPPEKKEEKATSSTSKLPNAAAAKSFLDADSKKKRLEAYYSKDGDASIDSMRMRSESETKQLQNLMYLLKYGDK